MSRTGHHPTVYEYVHSRLIAKDYELQHTGNRLFDLDVAFLDAELPAASLVYDLGCGTGRAAVYLIEKGHRVVGADLSRAMLMVARRKGLQALLEADILELPFASGTADACIMMFSVLGMICRHSNRLRALNECHRVLKPGGVLIFHVHNRMQHLLSPSRWRSLANGYIGRAGLEPGDKIVEHYYGLSGLYLHLFTRAEILGLLERSGFRLKRLEMLRPDRLGFLNGPAASLRADGFFVSAIAE